MVINSEVQIIVYFLLIALVTCLTCFLMIKGKKTTLLYSFLAFQCLVLVWLIRIVVLKIGLYTGADYVNIPYGTSFELYERTHYKLKYYIECIMALCWLVFCILYAESRILKNKKILAAITLGSLAIFYLSVIWFEKQPTSFNKYYTAFMTRSVLKSIYYCFGIGIIIKKCVSESDYLRKQSLLLIFSVMFPTALNLFQDYKRFVLNTGGIIYNLDITPFGFVVEILFIVLAAYRYRFLDVMPIALRKLIHYIDEGVIFVDSLSTIMDYNKQLEAIFDGVQMTKKGSPITAFLESIEASVIKDNDYYGFINALKENNDFVYRGELKLTGLKNNHISVKINPIYKLNRTTIGRVICFTDITEYKQLIRTIYEKNEELTALNVQLEEYAAVAEELAVTKERNRMAREIHDTLGHTMTVLISLLEATCITSSKTDEAAYKRLREAADIAREGLREVRRSVEGLAPSKLKDNDIITALQKLIEEFRGLGITIELSVAGNCNTLESKHTQVLYRIVQEAVTNAVRHGRASHMDIILKLSNDKIKIYMIDDGLGCKKITKGFGLLGMEQRVSSLNGSIKLGSDGERGFNIHIEIPL